MELETARLRLREMTQEDFEALKRVFGDDENMKHYPYTFDDSRIHGWIERNMTRYSIFGFGLWAVTLRETGEVIGDCGLTMQMIGDTIKPEIGFHIRADQQRRGYAREAACAVRDWAFGAMPFRQIFCYQKYTNIGSRATAQAMGMQQVDEFPDDVNTITTVYAMMRQAWENLKAE